jgi:hypothetical protein
MTAVFDPLDPLVLCFRNRVGSQLELPLFNQRRHVTA